MVYTGSVALTVKEALGNYLAAWDFMTVRGDELCNALEEDGQVAPREALEIFKQMRRPWQSMFLTLPEESNEDSVNE